MAAEEFKNSYPTYQGDTRIIGLYAIAIFQIGDTVELARIKEEITTKNVKWYQEGRKYYDLARIEALSGNDRLAMDLFRRSIESGFSFTPYWYDYDISLIRYWDYPPFFEWCQRQSNSLCDIYNADF